MVSTSDSQRAQALLRSRVEDALSLCERRNMPVFYGFLDEAEQQLARSLLRAYDAACVSFYGGHDEAERRILGIFPAYMPPDKAAFPLVRLVLSYRVQSRPLTHRDFLGTLLSLGVKRETVGDILCGDGLAVVFLREEIAPFVREQMTKVGGVGVTLREDYAGPLPAAHTYRPLEDTVASARLDAIVKALARTSREQAASLIVGGMVSLNHTVTEDVSHRVEAPCTVSVRGVGRFVVDRLGPLTKKGRLVLTARKCI